MKKQRLKLNKVSISKIDNMNTILGGETEIPMHTNQHSCHPRETCRYSACATTTTNTDTTDGEATGIGGRTTSNNMG